MARILVADDDDMVRKTIRRMLELAGHEVTEAQDGVQCERIAATAKPDIVITDIVMPEQEGIETIRRLRRAHPELNIMAISGGGLSREANYLQTARKLG